MCLLMILETQRQVIMKLIGRNSLKATAYGLSTKKSCQIVQKAFLNCYYRLLIVQASGDVLNFFKKFEMSKSQGTKPYFLEQLFNQDIVSFIFNQGTVSFKNVEMIVLIKIEKNQMYLFERIFHLYFIFNIMKISACI